MATTIKVTAGLHTPGRAVAVRPGGATPRPQLRPPASSLPTVRSFGLVSVCIAAYRAQQWLRDAVQSILMQRMPPGWSLEILIGVDGCPDTLRAALDLDGGDVPIRVFDCERGGCYRTRNTLLQHARGDVIAVHDADDVSLPDRFLRQIALIDSGADMVVGGATDCDEQLRPTGRVLPPPPTVPRTVGEAANAIHPSWLLRRRVFDVLGGYRPWECGADSEMYIRALAHPRIAVSTIAEPLIRRRCHRDQLTRTLGLGSFARTDALRHIEQTWQTYRAGHVVEPVHPECSDVRAVHAPRAGVLVVMPTIPERASTAGAVIESMLRQGADMRVYMQGHSGVPSDWPRTRRIQYILGPRRGPLVRYSAPDEHHAFVLTADDDLAYPSDYVSTTIGHLRRLGPGHAVAWHGMVWPSGFSQYRDRQLTSFRAGVPDDVEVTMAGSGVLAMHAETWQRLVELDKPHAYDREDDVWVSSRLASLGIVCIRPRSGAEWIVETDVGRDGLWRAAVSDQFVARDAAIRQAIVETGWQP